MEDEVLPSTTINGSVENAQLVNHAEHVQTSVHTDLATEVLQARTVGVVEKMEIHGEPLRSNATRRRKYVRDIAQSFLSIFALAVMVTVIVDKNIKETDLRGQLRELESKRTAADVETAAKVECNRRYQDVIDAATETQLILIGEFLVVITQIPPGPERETAVADKIRILDQTNVDARKAVVAKINYNNAGNPLPCPLPESVPDPSVPVGG